MVYWSNRSLRTLQDQSNNNVAMVTVAKWSNIVVVVIIIINLNVPVARFLFILYLAVAKEHAGPNQQSNYNHLHKDL